MEDYQIRAEEMVKRLNEASDAYYNGREELMSNYEWDSLFDELVSLEAETGFILPDSHTQNTGYEENNYIRAAGNYIRSGYYKEARTTLDGVGEG